MKKILLLCVAMIALSSCNNYGGNYDADTTPADSVLCEGTNVDPLLQEMIEVGVNFEPRTELTDEIRNTTLVQLIREDTRKIRIDDQMSYFYEGAVKKVPASSNLAKVYYLENLHAFLRLIMSII